MEESLIVSVSGLRGVVGRALTPTVAATYAVAFAQVLPPGPIVLGRDGRTHGPLLARAITDALVDLGRDVLDCGIAATPTVGIVVDDAGAAGGIQISASHNPAEYNGMKLFSAAGRVLPAEAGERVLAGYRALVSQNSLAPPSARNLAGRRGAVRSVDGTAAHVRLVAATVDVEAIRRVRPRVWIDCGHGAGSRVGLPLLAHLGCEVVAEGGVPDGLFAHAPEPTAENLAGLLPQIVAAGADVGFFQDPDADRLAIATAAGRYIGEEATLALAVGAVLRKTPGPIVVNCSTSGMAAAIASRHGVACQVSKVGEANVVDAMLAVGAVLGGEGNGGVIDPRVVLVRDSGVAMALVLEQMCVAGRLVSLESLAGDLPRLVMRKTKFNLAPGIGGPALAAALQRVATGFPEARISRLDGLRLDWPTGWLLVRASNTEPIVRLVGEDEDAGRLEARIHRAAEALQPQG